jgi:oxygen-independent coproporphyrinogen-3 oxidase
MIGVSLPPLSLYIHIPWCVRKCPYCDFNSHAQNGELPETEYVAALLADLDLDLDLHAAQACELRSIFFGGGTPSLLSPQAIGKILDGVNARIHFARDIEITLEANPGTTEQERFFGFRSAGINRLSLGVQSLNPLHLHALGRIHSSAQAINAVKEARRAGFDNINLDLMHGLPQQSIADACADLQQALALAPEHLSWYQLTIEPNTEFFKRPPLLPPDDTLAAIQDAGFEVLEQSGYRQYEVSAFAQPNRRARHNLNYWEFGDYLGIGAGAHGKLTTPDGTIMRTQKTRLPRDYLASGGRCDRNTTAIEADELPFEFAMNALRLNDGFAKALYSERTGQPWATIAPTIERLIGCGLLAEQGGRVAATALGRRFLNDVLGEFL